MCLENNASRKHYCPLESNKQCECCEECTEACFADFVHNVDTSEDEARSSIPD